MKKYREGKIKPKTRLLAATTSGVIGNETGQCVTGHDQEYRHAKQEETVGNVLTSTHIKKLTEDLIFREVRLFRKKLGEMKMVVSGEQIGFTAVALTYILQLKI